MAADKAAAAAAKKGKKKTPKKTKKTPKKTKKTPKEKAEDVVFDHYVKAMGAAVVTASALKSANLKKLSAAKKKVVMDDCCLRVGMKVAGRWDDDDGTPGWYDAGRVLSINYEQKTTYIKYDDDDVDDSVPWNNIRIL